MSSRISERVTRQRAAISAALERAHGFKSAQDIHADLRTGDAGVGLTTVYRTLQALADAGEVDVIRKSGGEAMYRRCGTGEHHHHLVCRACGRAEEVGSKALEEWATRTARKHGFTEVSHVAELYGVCGACSSA